MPTALFVGSHPDDLDIGAGGTINKLASLGWDVWLIITTDEKNSQVAETRRSEARASGRALGIPETHILFASFPDGGVQCNLKTVQKLRDLVAGNSIAADIVFTHSGADDHQDHRATHEIVCAAIRRKPRLYFPVVNHLIDSAFSPNVFIDVEAQWDVKLQALQAHSTQASRIKSSEIESLSRRFFGQSGIQRSEAYELDMPVGAEDGLALILEINDSSFHKFWYPLIGKRPLHLIYAIPVVRAHREFDWRVDMDREGIDIFRKGFNLHWSIGGRTPLPIEDLRCDHANVDATLQAADVLLSGGPVSNAVTRNYFNHFPGMCYVIDYLMPDYRRMCILDRFTGQKMEATYEKDEYGHTVPSRDLGILTIMKNPCAKDKHLISVMGIHGFGTVGCYKIISEPNRIAELLSIAPSLLTVDGYQILVEYKFRSGEAVLLKESLRTVNLNDGVSFRGT